MTVTFPKLMSVGRQLLWVMIAIIFSNTAIAQYELRIDRSSKDTSFPLQALQLTTSFNTQVACVTYINQLPALLRSKGFAAASVDQVHFDTSFARILLFVGTRQNWIQLQTNGIEKRALEQSGYLGKNFNGKLVDIKKLDVVKEQLLRYYENNGYPFAAVGLDSIQLFSDSMLAQLKVVKGPLYHVDSISVKGKAKLSNLFLQKYLGIPKGAVYNKSKLDEVSKKILELPFVQEEQESDLTLLGTGSVLNLYLQPKRSSQVNFLIGFLPANNETGKLQLTGDINLNLKNMLGHGETILLNWQQLQLQSPRLNIGFQQPYIFKSDFGVDFLFELFKKDSAFIQLNAQLGLQYLFSGNQSGKLFIQQQRTFLQASGIDTNQVKINRQLPVNIDVSAVNVGIDYEWNNTNYKFNPRRGNELRLTGSVGIKNISKNDNILALVDPGFDFARLYDSIKLKSYQFRLKLAVAHYFPVAKQGTIKLSANGGWYNSQQIFRNELFQIGGFKLLRGFDEESIYATQYAVATAEFRQLFALNSYLFAFVDAGWVSNQYQQVNVRNQYISAGFGLVFETKLGLLNMSLAVGKRNDVKTSLGQSSKIHFGYINYF